MQKPAVETVMIHPHTPLREAIAVINQSGLGIALVVDPQGRLLETLTDGDIRRTLLSGTSMDTRVGDLPSQRQHSPYPEPVTAPLGTSRAGLLKIMQTRYVRQVPLLDPGGRVAGLVTLEELLPEQALPMQAVVMAGGQAARLHPLVEDLPKPMLPVGNQPLLELTIAQLQQAGIRQVYLTTHYKPETITDHFGDGRDFGVDIQYLDERQPLGTAGALSRISQPDQPLLVINGDVLTRVDFRAMLAYHREQRADLTIAVRQYEFAIPYGVVETMDDQVSAISEKPTLQRFINAGIYLLEPDVLSYIPSGQPDNMPDLINRLVAAGLRVVSFPLHEYWLDIQEYQDYQQALADARQGVFGDLGSAAARLEPGAPVPQGVIPLSVPEMRGNEWAYIKECLDTNWVSSVGPFVDRFEQQLAEYVGVTHAVATSTGTAALHIALLVAGVQPDDEVLVPSLTFIAPANAVRYAGAWPVFIDAEPVYWQMDPQKVADFLEHECRWQDGALYNRTTGRRIKALLPVNILGHPVDYDALRATAQRYGLVIIEDATESLGARYKDRMTGACGDIACFSFNGNKIITTGGGGMIVTNRPEWARQARYLTTQAKDDPLEYVHQQVGYNYRLTNLQAAMGCAQMEQLAGFLQNKRRFAAAYAQALAAIPGLTGMTTAPWAEGIFWLYTILVEEAGYGLSSRELLNRLAQARIQTRPLWQPMHRSPAHAQSQAYHCDVSERLYRQALSLPSSAGMTVEEQQQVIAALQTLGGKP